ncbi:hypothetical protein EYZ11_012389 [Aspergillus tanneri]|uniref:Uncharacterized protein n=1 Tax=Aspergillus tanneri TaxID=1220188 RepID=A0A4S3J2G9_9EURO|nr:hypothetical protein EYZ11_012389 [Aspergillus tanneri]
MEDLLKPCHFDWADEDASEDYNASGDTTEELDVSNHREEEWLEAIDITDDTQIDEPEAIANHPLPFDGADTNLTGGYNFYRSIKTLDIRETMLNVIQEFAYRNSWVLSADGERIHHFNWMGFPVSRYSGTPPEISLLFQLSDPKAPQPGDEHRFQSIFNRALRYIDPVIVNLENSAKSEGLNHLMRLKGYDLVRFTTGRVTKFYSPHGWWMNDDRGKEERTSIDDGILEVYMDERLITGNGFVRLGNISDRSQWEESRDENLDNPPKARRRHSRSRDKAFKPSPLRQVMTAEDLPTTDTEVENEGPLTYATRTNFPVYARYRSTGTIEQYSSTAFTADAVQSRQGKRALPQL